MPVTEQPPATQIACAHCGLPVPGEEASPHGPSFCCAGCRTVWDILHSHGLEGYYRVASRETVPVGPSDRSFEEFDHATFANRYVQPAGELRTTELYLQGVHCAACVWLVERLPRVVPGVSRTELDLPRGRARVWWDPHQVSLSRIAQALDTLGYRPHPFRGLEADRRRRLEDREHLARIGIAGAIAANVMLIALAMYSGWFFGIEAEYERFFRWTSLALATPAVLGPGRVFFRGAYGSLRLRALHMDVPIATALAVGFGRGIWNTVTDAGPVYFDGVTVLIFLLLVGRYLQHRAQRSAQDHTELLQALAPAVARVYDPVARLTREIPVDALLPGMLIRVRAGETVPADGVVVEGSSEINGAILSGESRPDRVVPSDQVWTGTVNLSAPITVRVDRTGEESRIGKILALVSDGAKRQAPAVALAQRTAGWFVGAVLVLALGTLLFWWRVDPRGAVDHAIALLIVTCPCALALATPLAVSAAIGRAAKAGILIKGGDALERLGGHPGTIYLDKTGTLTAGNTALLMDDIPPELRGLILGLEAEALHPIAKAFREAWPDVAIPVPAEVRHITGRGVEGIVEGRSVIVGSISFVSARLGRPVAPALSSEFTPVVVAVDGGVAGVAGFGDPLRPEAEDLLADLRAGGWAIRILTGDAPGVAREVGRKVGARPEEIISEATPEAKAACVSSEVTGPVIMVGDGVNDAAAMARADVGIAVEGSAEASLAAADIHLAQGGLQGINDLLRGARRTMHIIRRNIMVSVLYNAVGASLAMMGLLTPWVAAILMPISSITVIVHSWRSRTFGTPV